MNAKKEKKKNSKNLIERNVWFVYRDIESI